jgi:hypothetical protein
MVRSSSSKQLAVLEIWVTFLPFELACSLDLFPRMTDRPTLMNRRKRSMKAQAFHHLAPKTLLFIATKRTRPDIGTAIAILTTPSMRQPDKHDWEVCLHVSLDVIQVHGHIDKMMLLK